MDKKIILVGEPMALLMATKPGDFADLYNYDVEIAGAEFNVAVGMKRLGHNVSYMTKLGNDPFGKLLANFISKRNIDTSKIIYTESHSTGMMLKSLPSSQEDPDIYYYRSKSAASTLNTQDINNIDLTQYTNLHLTGILPALSDSTKAATLLLLLKAKKQGLSISFDPNIRKQLWKNEAEMVSVINGISGLSNIFMPGIKEGIMLTGKQTPEEIADFYLNLGVETVVIKLGSKGCYVAQQGNAMYVEGYNVDKIVDTVGAGDGFATGFVSSVMEGLTLEQAAKRANAIGALQLMSRGDNDGLPTREQLDAFMNNSR